MGESRGYRSTVKVYYDILVAIHRIGKAGENATLYNLGHRAKVPNGRLKERLSELLELGLVDSNRNITEKGYEYCEAFNAQVAPFLRKYVQGSPSNEDSVSGASVPPRGSEGL